MEEYRQNTTSSKQSARPSPGLTLESLNFRNIPKTFKHTQRSQETQKEGRQGNNLIKYSKVANNEEIQKNLTNYELFFEKNSKPSQKKKSNPRSLQQANNKADIYYPKNYKDSNAEVLSKILDSKCEFSPNAPSNLKICQNELDEMNREEYKNEGIMEGQEEGMNNNNINPIDMGMIDNQMNMGIQGSQPSEGENKEKKLTINQSYSGESIIDTYLESVREVMTLLDPTFEGLSMVEKVEKYIALTDDERKSTRLGALVCLYIIIRKYNNDIDEEHKNLVIDKVISLLKEYNKQEEIFLCACLELCSLYGAHEILIENRQLICMFITDFNFPLLQNATFNCLMCMEYEGIRTLIELASKDYEDYQTYILNRLIKTPHIQKIIIIRALLNELYSNDAIRRNNALAALSRMHDLVSDQDTLEKLHSFFIEPKINKEFIASIFRTCGQEGENILLNEIKTNKDFAVRTAIANAFSYRLPKEQKYLDIRLDKNDTASITNNLPGSFCRYYGNVTPFIENKNYTIEYLLESEEFNDILVEDQLHNAGTMNSGEQVEEYLEVNTRDFLASLQRMLDMDYDHSYPRLVHNGNANTIDNISFKNVQGEILEKYAQFFDLSNVINPNSNMQSQNKEQGMSSSQEDINIDDSGKYFISEDVIKALGKCLNDYSAKVREAAATSLGIIGLPEALLSIDHLVESINDDEVNVKAKIIWAIGRVAEGTDNSIIPFILDAVKGNMWKVKKAALYCLCQLGDRAAKLTLPYLIKILKESPLNKQLIAETIVKLGVEGESVLLKIMAQEPDSKYKLKASITHALAYTDITSRNIDFIIECVFKQGRNSSPLVRKASIFTIKILAEKADEKLTYLKRKNIIPFYYDKLKDKDAAIQRYAINCLKSLGPQGQLIFIEGFIKDPNPIIRANCAIGLGEIGVDTLRTLLIGFHDDDPTVRATVEKIIVSQFAIEDIIGYFSQENSGNQLLSLKVAIKDIINKKYPLNMITVNYFNTLLEEIDKFK